MSYDYFVGIDPGQNTGVAIFKEIELRLRQRPRPLFVDYTKPTAKAWEDRVQQTLYQVQSWLQALPAKSRCKVIIEQPLFMETEAGSASARSDALIKLTLAAGALWGRLAANPFWDVNLIKVGDWKGQMPKHAVVNRLSKIVHQDWVTQIHSHGWDAVGIVLNDAGKF